MNTKAGTDGVDVGRVGVRHSTRIKNSTKPKFVSPEPVFYRCSGCGGLMIKVNRPADRDAGQPGVLPDVWSGNRTESIGAPRCCGVPMVQLRAGDDRAPAAAEHRPHITVAGGFDANAIHITVGDPPHPMGAEHAVDWIYLYTFQGGQIKFTAGADRPTATFALADADAYVYCDRPVCLGSRCKFNCKRGFTAYAYCRRDGLWKTTL